MSIKASDMELLSFFLKREKREFLPWPQSVYIAPVRLNERKKVIDVRCTGTFFTVQLET
jgi:hypothetical protein